MTNTRKSDEKEARRLALIERIDQRREALGLADNEISLAGGNRYIMRDLRGRGSIPSTDKLVGIAQLLGVSVDWLTGRDADAMPRAVEASPAPGVGDVTRTFRQAPKDLPIYGTAHGHTFDFDDNGGADIETTIFEPGEVVRHIARPPALNGVAGAYALYIQGDSMFPAHRPGALVVVDPRKPPAIGDDVIVQLARPLDEGQEIVSVLIKTLERRTAAYVELTQYNPPRTFKVHRDNIAEIHRVVPLGDLLGA